MSVIIRLASHVSKQTCNSPVAVNAEKKDFHTLFSTNPIQSCWVEDS